MVLGSTAYCDTSFFAATLNPRDQYHERAAEINHYAAKEKTILFTSWEVIDETATLLLVRGNAILANHFIKKVIPQLEIVDYDKSYRKEILKHFLKFNSGKKIFSFTDVTSYVIIKYLLKDIPLLTFDHDFLSLGLYVIGLH